MLNLQSGLKYRQRIESKLSLAARKPTENLCDIDPLEEEIFQDKNADEVAEEVKNEESTANEGKKKKKKTKKKGKRNQPQENGGGDIFKEIMEGQSDNDDE